MAARYVTTRVARSPARIWLMLLGWLLVAAAVLGLIPAATKAAHSFGMHLEGAGMVLHWVLAVVTLLLAYTINGERTLAAAAILYGVAFLVLGGLGFGVAPIGPWHVGLADNLVHLAVGAVTLLTGFVTLRRLDPGSAGGRRRAAA